MDLLLNSCSFLVKWNTLIVVVRLVKEQMGNGKSQETLASIGQQSSSEKGAEEQEEETGEGSICNNDVFH